MYKYEALYMGYERDEFGYTTKFVVSDHIHFYCVGRLRSRTGWLAHTIHFIARYSERTAFLITIIFGGTVNIEQRKKSDGHAVYRREGGDS